MIASPHTRLSCGHEISTTAGLSEGVVFAKRKQGNNWLRSLSEDPPDTLPPTPPPAALRWTAELQMGLTLWLIKDLPGEFGIILLTFKAARWGGTLHQDAKHLRTGSHQTTLLDGLCGVAVNREKALSFVVNYKPTQSPFSWSTNAHLPRKEDACPHMNLTCIHVPIKATKHTVRPISPNLRKQGIHFLQQRDHL